MNKNIRKIIVLIFSVIFFATTFLNAAEITATAERIDGETTVYITKTGECYHTGTCGSLKKSKIETTLQTATDAGYRACSKCHPPVLTDTTSKNSKSAAVNSVKSTDTNIVGNTVYITATGKKYHTGGCSYLKNSKIPISEDDAEAQGYEPCSRCKP